MATSTLSSKRMVCVGAFAGAHGIRGEVHIKFFTEKPWKVGQFPEMWNEAGSKSYHLLQVKGAKKDRLIASFKEIQTPEEAQALKGTRLYVTRDSLPEIKEDEIYYQVDLMACEVYTLQGELFGTVKGIENFGAGDILEILPVSQKDSVYVPFSKSAIPEVDLKNSRMTLDVDFVFGSLKDEDDLDS